MSRAYKIIETFAQHILSTLNKRLHIRQTL